MQVGVSMLRLKYLHAVVVFLLTLSIASGYSVILKSARQWKAHI